MIWEEPPTIILLFNYRSVGIAACTPNPLSAGFSRSSKR
jgi:hypothetical protein